MNQDQIDALIALLQSTGFINVSCHREFDPPTVQILIPAGLGVTLPYDTYQQIRVAAGLPDHALRLMSYALPTSTDLRMRYPTFATVPVETTAWWLAYVDGKDVDQSWGSANGPEAHMAAAAGRMVKAGVPVAGSDVSGFAAAGVTDFKSGTFSAKFSDEAVSLAIAADWQTSAYGADYLAALAKEKGGTRVTLSGAVPCCNAGFNGYAGPLGYPAALFGC